MRQGRRQSAGRTRGTYHKAGSLAGQKVMRRRRALVGGCSRGIEVGLPGKGAVEAAGMAACSLQTPSPPAHAGWMACQHQGAAEWCEAPCQTCGEHNVGGLRCSYADLDHCLASRHWHQGLAGCCCLRRRTRKNTAKKMKKIKMKQAIATPAAAPRDTFRPLQHQLPP